MLIVIREGWSETAQQRFLDEACDGLALAGLRGDPPMPNLDFLRDLSGLRALVLGGQRVSDTSAVFQQRELEELGLPEWVRQVHGIGQLGQLRKLALWHCSGIDELCRLRRLVALNVEGWPAGGSLAPIGDKPHLTELSISLKKRAAVTTAGLSALPKLTSLTFIFGSLGDTDALWHLVQLEDLKFASTSIPDLSFVEAMPHLRILELEDVGEIPSFGPLRRHPRLEQFAMVGTTRVADGDLTPLFELANLKSIAIDHTASHYSHTAAQVLEHVMGLR